ncbi:hypothetical protein [Novosphingobium sp.]|uniref:hypothetical protein n=1 Tax=Novosphingobium sp. TaxID=1874826 RepID=UPI0025D50FC3|nr:hypothetical protein [Novosphingobium sp.]
MSRKMSPAARRYTLRLAVLMTAYVGLLFFARTIFDHGMAHGPIAYILALLPALPIIGVFWAVMRLIVEETDEFVRLLHVRQCLVATGFCLTVMTIWEWLQNFDLVASGNGGFGAAFFWFAGLGVGALYNRLTLGTAGGCA